MKYKVLGFSFDGKHHEVLGRFEFGTTRVKDDQNPDFVKAAVNCLKMSNDKQDIYAIVEDK